MKHIPLAVTAILLATLLVGCNGVEDVALESLVVIPSGPSGEFGHVAWIDNNQIVMRYEPDGSYSSANATLYRYDIPNDEWKLVEISRPQECSGGFFIFPNRMLDEQFALVYFCLVGADTDITGMKAFFYTGSSPQLSLSKWAEYEVNSEPRDFTFSPDGETITFTTVSGQIYQATQTSMPVQILTNYYEVTSPRWSPDEDQLAFGGADEAAKGTFFDPNGIFARLNIYITSSDLQSTTTVIQGVVGLTYIRWSPSGRWLAFAGNYQNKDGIFIIDPETNKTTRIWSQVSFYDWSPDGTQMVIIQRQDGENTTQPLIVNLPPEFQDPS